MKNETKIFIGIVVIMVIIISQGGKKEGDLIPPTDLTDCNVVYRASWQNVDSSIYINNPPMSIGSNNYIYYRPTETVYKPVAHYLNGCSLTAKTHIYGGIYYSPSSNEMWWIGTNTKNGEFECVRYIDAQGSRDSVAEYSHCHVPYDMYYGSTAIGMYDKLVLCDFGNRIGPCGGTICEDTSWLPVTSSVCSGDSFSQTSNCGTTRQSTGTKDCEIPSDCSSNSDCGSSGYFEDPWCDWNEDVRRKYKTYTCNNPGTLSSYCTNEDEVRTVEACVDCEDGVCVGGTCNTPADLDCNNCVDDSEFPGAVYNWKEQIGDIPDSLFPTIVYQWKTQEGC